VIAVGAAGPVAVASPPILPLTYRKMLTEGLIGPIAVSAGARQLRQGSAELFCGQIRRKKENVNFPWPINVLKQSKWGDFHPIRRAEVGLQVVSG
jgi:hypothetical protein